jgi:hypothetical protein
VNSGRHLLSTTEIGISTRRRHLRERSGLRDRSRCQRSSQGGHRH